MLRQRGLWLPFETRPDLPHKMQANTFEQVRRRRVRRAFRRTQREGCLVR